MSRLAALPHSTPTTSPFCLARFAASLQLPCCRTAHANATTVICGLTREFGSIDTHCCTLASRRPSTVRLPFNQFPSNASIIPGSTALDCKAGEDATIITSRISFRHSGDFDRMRVTVRGWSFHTHKALVSSRRHRMSLALPRNDEPLIGPAHIDGQACSTETCRSLLPQS
ncbi:hypothetical protein T440DRAFT_164870 [Plenodomus tracheiphilus IPT5]|uniref:Uncharacterized protein n=1 Tax=Plenodomus tracheiphilus IPT5 TaxID=1408161 RepID=A0A6A7BK14_9PLEO|nr:hypothetical protein T440DRAFT_164870 [Plenodomus tracheiphilus IPT5]